jgi:hypothetical protein
MTCMTGHHIGHICYVCGADERKDGAHLPDNPEWRDWAKGVIATLDAERLAQIKAVRTTADGIALLHSPAWADVSNTVKYVLAQELPAK